MSKEQKPKFSVALQTPTYQDLITNTLKDPKRSNRFIASISSAVAVNPDLQACDAGSILSGALLGESLQLSPSPQLGQFYLVPFKKKEVGMVATFILGYKGYTQLAIRSGHYKKINVVPLKEGELVYFDPMTEDIEVNLIQDYEEREAAPTTGYYAFFEYQNGFKKALYWSKEKMVAHADKYSPAFKRKTYEMILSGKIPASDLWKSQYSSFWYKDFDTMGCKTMLRQLLSKWGLMSIEMQEAFEKDESVIHSDGTFEHLTQADIEKLEVDIDQQVIETVPDEVNMNEL